MKKAGHSTKYVLRVWAAVVALPALSALLGYLFLAGASDNVIAAIQSFCGQSDPDDASFHHDARGARGGGAVVGVVTALGFLVAFLTKLE
jgi:zinc transporter, ZIP family